MHFYNKKSTFLYDPGVVEYLSNGGVAENHKDFKELRYNECLTNFSCNGKNGNSDGSITHSFQLKSAYDSNLMPYTNYTYDFKVKTLLRQEVLRPDTTGKHFFHVLVFFQTSGKKTKLKYTFRCLFYFTLTICAYRFPLNTPKGSIG